MPSVGSNGVKKPSLLTKSSVTDTQKRVEVAYDLVASKISHGMKQEKVGDILGYPDEKRNTTNVGLKNERGEWVVPQIRSEEWTYFSKSDGNITIYFCEDVPAAINGNHGELLVANAKSQKRGKIRLR